MKHFSLIILLVSIMIFAVSAHAQSPGWQVDSAHSSVGFSVRHLGISKVKGNFKGFTASIKADEKGMLTYVEGTVKIADIYTGIEARDKHLRAADFFDAGKFPTATLKTKSINIKGNKISGTSDLTLKGVTKSVAFSGEFLGSNVVDFGKGKTLRAGYSVEAKINRQDFGLSFNKIVEGVSVVGDEVTISLEMEIFIPVK